MGFLDVVEEEKLGTCGGWVVSPVEMGGVGVSGWWL